MTTMRRGFPGTDLRSRGTDAPEFCSIVRPRDRRAQGRPGARRTRGPRAIKKHGAGTADEGGIIRPSLRSGLRLTSRSLRGPGFLAPVIARHVTAQLDL